VFEERLTLAETALQKSDIPAFERIIALIAGDIAALPEESIAVRERWKEKRALSQETTLRAFAPVTVARLRQDIAPLMQWRNIRGFGDAYALDLLIARMQVAVLRRSGHLSDLKIELIDRLAVLQMHLNPVREKAEVINRVKSNAFWNGVSVATLEDVRIALREVIHHRQRAGGKPLPPKIIDVTEVASEVQFTRRATSLKAIDMNAYQRIVETELRKHFDSDPTLKKIRAGDPVSEKDFEALVSLILTQSPNASREVLAEFFSATAEPLQYAIRAIIGMDPKAVEARFSDFARKYPLSAKQTRFLALLQNHIARYGSITIDRLYESPFTVVDADSLDGVFESEDEINDLLQVIRVFIPPEGDHMQPRPNERMQ
jgi:type I restriction enzyme R subunit